MPISTLLTRVDGSAGRIKANARAVINLAKQISAEEWNNIAQAVVDLLAEVGLSNGSTPGSLVARVTTLEGGGGAGGAWTHLYTDGSTAVPITTPRTIVTAAVADVDLLIDLPDPAASEGWIVMVRKVSGSDGYGVWLRPDAVGDLRVEGDVVETRTVAPETGAWMIPGSNQSSYDLGDGDRVAPIAAWLIYSDGDSWRFGPGTLPRVLEEVLDPRNTAVTARELIAHGTFAGTFLREPAAGQGTVERAWICSGFQSNGSGGVTPRWVPLSHVRVRTITADDSLLDHDEIVIVDTSGGPVDLTLPANRYYGSAPSWTYSKNNEGRQILILKKTTDANAINLVRPDLSTYYPTYTPDVEVNGDPADLELPGSTDGVSGARWHLFGDDLGGWWV